MATKLSAADPRIPFRLVAEAWRVAVENYDRDDPRAARFLQRVHARVDRRIDALPERGQIPTAAQAGYRCRSCVHWRAEDGATIGWCAIPITPATSRCYVTSQGSGCEQWDGVDHTERNINL